MSTVPATRCSGTIHPRARSLPARNQFRAIEAATGRRGTLEPLGGVPGGDINRAERARIGDTNYFIKLNEARRVAMFEAEAAGMTASRIVRQVIEEVG